MANFTYQTQKGRELATIEDTQQDVTSRKNERSFPRTQTCYRKSNLAALPLETRTDQNPSNDIGNLTKEEFVTGNFIGTIQTGKNPKSKAILLKLASIKQ